MHDGGDDPAYYRHYSNCPVNFNHAYNEIAVAADCCDQIISDAGRETADLSVQQFELLISRLSKQSILVDDVR